MEEGSKSSNSFYAAYEVGLDHVWMNQFDQASAFFKDMKDKDPRAALHFGEVDVARCLLSEKEEDRADAIKKLEKAIDLAESHLKQYEKGKSPLKADLTEQQRHYLHLDTRVVQADAYIILAAVLILDDSRIKGAISLRKGWKIYESALKQLENGSYPSDIACCIKFGAGLFLLLMSLIPAGVASKMAALAGFKSDKLLGVRYLRESYKLQSIRSPFSGAMLALAFTVLGIRMPGEEGTATVQEAHGILSTYLKRYPSNSFFFLMAALCAQDRFNLDESLSHLQTALKNAAPASEFSPVIARVLSNCYMMRLEWKQAVSVLERVTFKPGKTEVSPTDPMNSRELWHAVKLASSYSTAGDRDKMEKTLRAALHAPKKESTRWVTVMTQQCKTFLACGGWYCGFELLLLMGVLDKMLEHMSNQNRKSVVQQLDQLAQSAPGALTPLPPASEASGTSSALSFLSLGLFGGKQQLDEEAQAKQINRVQYVLLKAIATRCDGDPPSSLALLDELVQAKPALDKLYQCLTLIAVARAHALKKDLATALQYLKEADKLSGFTWDEPVRHRMHNYMQELHNAMGRTGSVEDELQKPDHPGMESDKDAAEALAEE